MNFNYAMLITLQDANGKNHINGIKTFSQRECVLSVANKVKRSTRVATCVCILKGYERSEVEQREIC